VTVPRQRATKQGEAVRDALQGLAGFHSAQDVYSSLRGDGSGVGLSTVYRHLQNLVDDGVVDIIHTPDGEATYRFCGPAAPGKHHHHLVCRQCGRTEEIEGRVVERWATEVAHRFDYSDVDHTVELFGCCADCRAVTASQVE
jgi:Fur family ferric uptake transcriptional regulator